VHRLNWISAGTAFGLLKRNKQALVLLRARVEDAYIMWAANVAIPKQNMQAATIDHNVMANCLGM
jgi:hypothetical protein